MEKQIERMMTMLELSEIEAFVYEQVKQGKTALEIGDAINKSLNYVYLILTFLVRHGAVNRIRERPRKVIYTANEIHYTIITRSPGGRKMPEKKRKFSDLKSIMRMIGKDNMRYVINHHGKMERRKIAAKIGIPKLHFNHICIVLGLNSEDVA